MSPCVPVRGTTERLRKSRPPLDVPSDFALGNCVDATSNDAVADGDGDDSSQRRTSPTEFPMSTQPRNPAGEATLSTHRTRGAHGARAREDPAALKKLLRSVACAAPPVARADASPLAGTYMTLSTVGSLPSTAFSKDTTKHAAAPRARTPPVRMRQTPLLVLSFADDDSEGAPRTARCGHRPRSAFWKITLSPLCTVPSECASLYGSAQHVWSPADPPRGT